MKDNILITGATGNISQSIIKIVSNSVFEKVNWILGVRSPHKLNLKITEQFEVRKFDFEDSETYDSVFNGVDVLFLIRPPQISDVEGVFRPVLRSVKKNGIKKVVFLSVQGADKMSFIPHSKIEKIIIELGFEYVFLRPSYFMQNIFTTLRKDFEQRNICLPAGNALFNWVDVDDVAYIAVETLVNFDKYTNNVFTLTGIENLSFYDVVSAMNNIYSIEVKYTSMNLLSFFLYKLKQGEPISKILVMIMLHYFPRFRRVPYVSLDFERIMGRKPTTLCEFLRRYKTIENEVR